MSLLRSPRVPAFLLLGAAALALVVANSPLAATVQRLMDAHPGLPGVLDLSVGHVIQDGLLAVFFFVVAVELRHELTRGELHPPRRALQPAIAAAGGVAVPIAIYLAVAGGSDLARGWPIPTATDIAFALGVLAVFGRGLPAGIRVFLLALAILDDVVGIILIAVLFTADLDPPALGGAAVGVVAFAVLSARSPRRTSVLVRVALVALALGAWVLVLSSGVHPTLAGVALGLAMAPRPAMRARHALEPAVNGIVLPLFAFSAALVVVPDVAPSQLSPAFWGVALALPLGKIVGIAGFGWLALRVTAPTRDSLVVPAGAAGGAAPPAPRMPFADLLAAGALGGIGFTVSLLLAELAFAGEAGARDEAVLGVLTGSAVSLLVAAVVVSSRARHYRGLAAARNGASAPADEDPGSLPPESTGTEGRIG